VYLLVFYAYFYWGCLYKSFGIKRLSSSLWSFLYSPVTLSLSSPNILLNTLFSNTLSLRSSPNVTWMHTVWWTKSLQLDIYNILISTKLLTAKLYSVSGTMQIHTFVTMYAWDYYSQFIQGCWLSDCRVHNDWWRWVGKDLSWRSQVKKGTTPAIL
jgi:hypothetical protein